MSAQDFLRVDRDGDSADARHYVVHLQDPKFTLELTGEPDEDGQVREGTLKRLCVPNSWAGDYQRYAKLLAAAQEFFRRTAGARQGAATRF
jgi:hypothetical protein